MISLGLKNPCSTHLYERGVQLKECGEGEHIEKGGMYSEEGPRPISQA